MCNFESLFANFARTMKYVKRIISSSLSFCLFLTIISIAQSCSGKRVSSNNELISGFIKHEPKSTGVTFSNHIVESNSLNHLLQMQIYNGAGVAIGDINNDNLPDLFFAGNQEFDRLYLNKGKFRFEDISQESGINQINGWSTGVTMADVNADGFLDIYVSRCGFSTNLKDSQNMLYINNGDLSFSESSREYGIQNFGCSTQGVFFDMDNDNDLDFFQMSQPPDPRIADQFGIEEEKIKFYKDRLYKNDDGLFTEVSKAAGVNRLAYGLGLIVSDFDNDGYMDIYVANDYDAPDYYYRNNQDGTFTDIADISLNHMSRFSMGSDAGDFNNDGYSDLVVVDMSAADHYRSKTNMGSMDSEEFWEIVQSGGHYQYMFNALQLNNGTGTFSEIAQLAGIHSTDWSWTPLIVDLNNDGWKDIFISNGIKRDIRNNDYVEMVNKSLKRGANNYLEMAREAPSTPISNYIFKNTESLKFTEVGSDWMLDDPAFSIGVSYGDLDQDGDLDLVMNNMNSPAFIYENRANGNYLKIAFNGPKNNPWGIGTKVKVFHNGKMQLLEQIHSRGYLSSVEPSLLFGLGIDRLVDSIKINWSDGRVQLLKSIKVNQTLEVSYQDSTLRNNSTNRKDSEVYFEEVAPVDYGIDFVHQEEPFDDFRDQLLLPYKQSQNGPFVSVGDINADGLDDFFVGGAAKQDGILYLQENKKFRKALHQPWQKNASGEDMGSTFFDADGDGDLDLYVCSGSNEFSDDDILQRDHFYLNYGLGNFVLADERIPAITEHTQVVRFADVDNDGDFDLFVGGRLINGKYPFPSDSYLLINENGFFSDKTRELAPDLKQLGLVTDGVFADIDNDNDSDLIIVGEWMPITILKNMGDIGFVKDEMYPELDNLRGLWWSVSVSDLDSDGDLDLIVGNLGENNKFKTSDENPFTLYANDFDNNGTHDVVLTQVYQGSFFPIRGKECSSQQMPFIKEKFADYHSYASSTLSEILPENTFESSLKREVNIFSSIVLLNQDSGFDRVDLPESAQISPIKSSLVRDFNGDGYKDLIVFGNHYPTEVETIRYDAGRGMLLLGRGSGIFEPLTGYISGLNINRDHRDSSFIDIDGITNLLITNNDDGISLLRLK